MNLVDADNFFLPSAILATDVFFKLNELALEFGLFVVEDEAGLGRVTRGTVVDVGAAEFHQGRQASTAGY
jgi:hypothetical protein